MRLLHAAGKTDAAFDDPNLVSRAGLVPVMRLAERCGLADLVDELVRIGSRVGVNAHLKVPGIVAGMVAGADSIEDLDVLRHGAVGRLFGGIRAPSTLGSFLRAFSWGNVRQLEAVGRLLLARLARCTPLLPGAEVLAFVDIDSTQKRVYGRGKQGVGFGHTKIQGRSLLVRGLNALVATPQHTAGRPGGHGQQAARREGWLGPRRGILRRRGGQRRPRRRCHRSAAGADGLGLLRRRGHRGDPPRRSPVLGHGPGRQQGPAAIASVPEHAWVSIRYPQAVFDDQLGRWISDAQVAEIPYTAFASKARQAVTARLIVRRVRDLNPAAGAGQGELFVAYRYHAVFTDSPFELVQAESQHRGHAIVEQVFADLNDGPLAHLPSGVFAANAAWLTLAATAHNLLRAAGCLAGVFHARARCATLREDLVNLAGRVAAGGRGHITVHLPEGWYHQHQWTALHQASCGPPQLLPAA